jgi:hypothetical protein
MNMNMNMNMNNKIGIIHLGKCHGIGMQHSLDLHLSSAIAQRGFDWYHMEPVAVNKHTDWIALMRNPIDRVISAFLFEHPKNAPYRKNPMHVTLPYIDKLKLYDCYDTMDDLATAGMAMLPPGQPETECTALAKRLLHDHMSFPGMTHFVWNYQSYYTELLQQAQTKNIYAVRAENMVDDLNAIEHLLGNMKPRPEFDSVRSFSHYTKGHQTPLPVTDKTVGPQGMHNLCELLCFEMMRYRNLANEAKNLKDSDRNAMQQRLREQCPLVADLQQCPNNREEFPQTAATHS